MKVVGEMAQMRGYDKELVRAFRVLEEKYEEKALRNIRSRLEVSKDKWDDGEIEERYPGFEELNVREVIEAIDPDHCIVENVPRCPKLEDPTRINGLAFGLPFDLERHFETSYPVPHAVETGQPDLTMSTRDNYNNTTYQRQELAEAKGVPTDWPEESVHAAIPSEYVRWLLSFCPSVAVEPPRREQTTFREVTSP